jgi:hypothetical protein
MKRALLIILSGLVLAAIAYTGVYRARTATSCCLLESQEPELAWLKAEFQLGDAEFQRVSRMHEEYLAGCAERCKKIDAKNAEAAALLAAANTITPEIEKALAEAALLRANCQTEMLRHFYQVSASMPPDQGKRYLAWVQGRTIGTDAHSTMHHH